MAANAEADVKETVQLSADFLKQFKCLACQGNLREPIVTCSSGHNICKQCKDAKGAGIACPAGGPRCRMYNGRETPFSDFATVEISQLLLNQI